MIWVDCHLLAATVARLTIVACSGKYGTPCFCHLAFPAVATCSFYVSESNGAKAQEGLLLAVNKDHGPAMEVKLAVASQEEGRNGADQATQRSLVVM